jgi:hypothetical protein
VFRLLRGCLTALIAGALFLAVGYAGWKYGGVVFPRLEEVFLREGAEPGVERQPSEEIAEASLQRFQELVGSSPGEEASFSGLEVTSMLRYSVPGFLPPGLTEPTVVMEEGTMNLSARISRADFPSFPSLEGVLEILPDTISLKVEAALVPFDAEHASVMVQGIDASAIPVPRRFIPDILEAVGRREWPGLPPNAVAVPFPRGISGAYIQDDRLVLVSGR